MSMTLLNPLPDLGQKIKDLQNELFQRNMQLNKAEEELKKERAKSYAIERGVTELRAVLSPLYQALQHVFGEIDTMGIGGTAAASTPKNKEVWENWKQKLGGNTAKAIDVLLFHGSMNRTQLRIQLGCATGTVVNVVTALNKAGLINKNGNKISLKDL